MSPCFEQIKAGTLAGAPVTGGSINERIAKETDAPWVGESPPGCLVL
jgi:hypothetical protein